MKIAYRIAFSFFCFFLVGLFMLRSGGGTDGNQRAPNGQAATERVSLQNIEGPFTSERVLPTLSAAVRDLPPPAESDPVLDREVNPRFNFNPNFDPTFRSEGGPDPLLPLQAQAPASMAPPSLLLNIDGNSTGTSPHDPVGDVGPTYYIQGTNSFGGSLINVINKTTGVSAGTFDLDTLGSNQCANGLGDPIILWDQGASRWFLSEFSSSGNRLCVYISQTSNPLGSYYAYNFTAANTFPDYPKYGVWPDGYYLGTNESSPTVYVMDRANMLTGSAATYQQFNVTDLSGFGFQMVTPSDWEGATTPPAGAPNYFMRHRDDEVHNTGSNNGSEDYLEIYEFDVDWVTPANTSFTKVLDLPVAEFDSDLCGLSSFNCFPQQGSATTLDPLREVIMWRLQYRNFGSHETLMATHVTDVNGSDRGGVRWYELRKVGAGAWGVHQQGTYSPDSDNRFMSSIAMDQDGNVALAYSVTSSSMFPSIRYTGREASDPLNTMSNSEVTIRNGTGTSGSNRWGDYSSLNLDPVDDCTYWYTMEYGSGGTRRTRISSFKFDNCGVNPVQDFTLQATPSTQGICSPNDAIYNLSLTAVNGLSGNVNLTAVGNPGTGVFSTNPVTLDGNSDLTISGATAGSYTFDIVGTHAVTASIVQTATVDLNVTAGTPGTPSLTTPSNGASGVALTPTFFWGAASGADGYIIDVATDAAFTNVVESSSGAATNYTLLTTLNSNTTYYWRVRATNGCGSGSNSSTFSFTTSSGSLACNGAAVDFTGGIPTDWSVVDNSGGGGIVWGLVSDAECEIANLTNGSGEAACADSDASGLGSPAYDTELVSNQFNLTNYDTITLTVAAYYNDLTAGSNDFFNVDYYDGTSWTTAVDWDEDHTPEDIALALPTNAQQIRFRYAGDGWDWYAQVDDVQLNCFQAAPIPEMVLSAASLESAQVDDIQVTQTLTITNVGTGSLTWSLAEDNSKREQAALIPPPASQFLTAAKEGDHPLIIAHNYLQTERQQWSLTSQDLGDYIVRDQYISKHNGIAHLYLRQRYQGIEVYQADINVNIARDGSIINLHNEFVPNLAARTNTTMPLLTAVEAVEAAARQLGIPLTQTFIVQEQSNEADRAAIISDGGISLNAIPARLVYQPVRGGVMLAWDIEIAETNERHHWSLRVDALTGEILDSLDLIIHEDFIEQATIAHGQAPIIVPEIPTPLIADNTTVINTRFFLAPDDYRVYDAPVESPIHNPEGVAGSPNEGRTLETDPADATASPYGWHDTDGVAGAEYTNTRGNNVFAYEDGNNSGYSPDCGGSLLCDFNLDLAQGPDTYEDAVITNLFYWNNLIHDVWYQYGFDEPAGNMQENNYGNGGVGGDSVNAEAQDGSGTCNANMGIVADGLNPRMQMYLCGSRDGSFDNGVIAHEYWHAVSTRLTGGPSSPGCLSNREQGGEGWSDFGALIMTIEVGDAGTDARGMGTYLIGEAADGPGIRPQPYSTDMSVNSFTYADVAGQAVPHGVGWGWATIIWDMTWALINDGVSQSGFDSDIYNGTGGNNLAMQLVIDGLKLQSCNPSFVDARDAILAADLANNGGVNQCVIWEAFARRGLGVNAADGGNGLGSEVEDFTIPAVCNQTLKLDKSVDVVGINASEILTYTLVARNDTVAPLTNVTISDTIQTNQSYVNSSATCGGSESNGVVTFPLGTINNGDAMTCTFQVQVANGIGSVDFFSDDFEDGSLTNWSTEGLWNVETESDGCGSTVAPFPSSDTAVYYGDDNDCDYATGGQTTGSLTLINSVNLPANSNPTLRFSYYLETEPTAGYDFAYVEISTDGSNWTELTELADSDWTDVEIDLSAYASENVQIRFRFDSTDSIANTYFGWLIDNVAIAEIATINNRACVTADGEGNACDDASVIILPALPACTNTSDIPWLSTSATSGTVLPSNNDIIDVIFNSAGLGQGTYTADLCVSSNDTNNAEVAIPVTMHVCVAPTAVSDLTITAAGNAADLQWSSTGAEYYEVWWGIDDPYFVPGNDCSAAANCVTTTGTSYMHSNAIGNMSNYTFAIIAANSCGSSGAMTATASNRYAEFDFTLDTGL